MDDSTMKLMIEGPADLLLSLIQKTIFGEMKDAPLRIEVTTGALVPMSLGEFTTKAIAQELEKRPCVKSIWAGPYERAYVGSDKDQLIAYNGPLNILVIED